MSPSLGDVVVVSQFFPVNLFQPFVGQQSLTFFYKKLSSYSRLDLKQNGRNLNEKTTFKGNISKHTPPLLHDVFSKYFN